jgi:hypothetical protein
MGKFLIGHKKNLWFVIGHKKISTSLLVIGLKFYSLLTILVLNLENKSHFCPS